MKIFIIIALFILTFLAVMDFNEAVQSVEAVSESLCDPTRTQVLRTDGARMSSYVLDRNIQCVVVDAEER